MPNKQQSKVKQLIEKRDLVVSRFDRFKSFMHAVTRDKSQIVQLKLRIAKAEDYWKEYEQLQDEIELADGGTTHALEREEFENSYFETMAQAQQLLNEASNLSTLVNMSENNDTSLSAGIKLPTLNLPNFSGSFEEWLPFREMFESVIHNNSALSNIQKFHYLRSSLRGEAAQTIQALQITAANYEVAWKLLTERFQNERLILQSHIRALFECTKVERENAVALRQLVDTMQKHVRALQALGQPTEHWDSMLIFLISSKLDQATFRAWETEATAHKLPTMKELTEFLYQRCQMLEAITSTPSNIRHDKQKRSQSFHNKSAHTVSHLSTESRCALCNELHGLFLCSKFLSKPVEDRLKEVKRLHLCINCLKPGHQAKQCQAGTCKNCHAKHNTLLHVPSTSSQNTFSSPNRITEQTTLAATAEPFIPASIPTNSCNVSCFTRGNSKIILSTAIVLVHDRSGTMHPCRVLLDSGSQSNFMTQRFAALLGLPISKVTTSISGIGEVSSSSQRCVQATIRSRVNTFVTNLQFVILPKITQNLPAVDICPSNWQLPSNIQLADPEFNVSQQIDALLGAEIFFELLCVGQFRPPSGYPIIQKTMLGWVVAGKISSDSTSSNVSLCHLSVNTTIDNQLQRFWELEEVSNQKPLSQDEVACERHFVTNTQRNKEGRFVVRLPIKTDAHQLGESKTIALRRLHSLERGLSHNPPKQAAYCQFMKEYQELGHMERVPESELNKEQVYYLPHHCVVKQDSTTTKLRVVFDASSKSSSGVSLNDCLLVGPTIQETLVSIVTRFRFPRYVMSADIEKMYRQIEVHPNDQDLQRILWRDSPQEPVSVFRLKTVTYGTASAPFLATRSLKKLALDDGENFPEAAKAILQDFYVDDILTGRDSMQDALQLQHQLIALLNTAGFKLRKWCANNQSLLTQIPETNQASLTELPLDKSQMVKSLGLLWKPLRDTFHFFVKPAAEKRCNTKRHILSSIARIFDPLGLLGPITVTAKIMLQQIWQLKLDWDEPLPPDLQCNWLDFQDELHLLEELTIPRRVVAQDLGNIELNGFCDASERAYGACIYVTTSCSNGRVTHLLCAKSRIAPLKTVTLPRLELCAAVLLSRLVSSVIEALHRNDIKVTLWSDSTIVLGWIRAPPTQWKTFVAHRTAEIQHLTNLYTWQHVRTEDNPADLISRGCMPSQMLHTNLWWQGPHWLAQSSFQGQQEHQDCVDLPERRSSASTLLAVESIQLVDKYSSLMKLQRVTAYCLRFIHNLRTQASDRLSGPLSTHELKQALMYWIKRTQAEAFAAELQALRNNHEVGAGSKLRSLCPFMDEESVIRVGGRLKNSSQPYDHKHPIILPSKHALTKLIAISEHRRQLHAGPTLLLASIRQRFWPLAGRRLVRQIIHQCVTCFRAKPKVASQRMGELPKHRTEQSRPFLHTGIDYCGPIYIKETHRRGTRTVKAYIAIFVCFSTKAVHIELVGDLTSEAFLGALRRFISRRGRCSCLYSDNASTFVGANKELKELRLLFTSESHHEKIQSLLNKEQIVWKFIPPYAPNFGGLWEAAVKSAKYHLKRIIGNSLLTFEEMYTSLTQIEACLNSRPLTPLSEDPNDLQALTPGHFLIGDTLTSMAEPSLQSIPFNRLSRWQYVQQLAQQFWSRWSREYLSELQQRTKWSEGSPNLSIGDMVLIKEDNTPPLSWHMGRVLDLHPGPDGLIRVASLRTSSGVVKRAISKICPLPI